MEYLLGRYSSLLSRVTCTAVECLGEDNVGAARQAPNVQSEPEAHRVERSAAREQLLYLSPRKVLVTLPSAFSIAHAR